MQHFSYTSQLSYRNTSRCTFLSEKHLDSAARGKYTMHKCVACF